MEKYNYEASVREDVYTSITDTYTKEEIVKNLATDRDDFYETLSVNMWVDDAVTGNGSGSYTFSHLEAEENLCHNMELLGEALREFGCDLTYLEKGAEACDVTIRCYLLGQVLGEVLDELAYKYADEIEAYEEDEDEEDED